MIMRPDNIVHVHDILVWYKRAGFKLYNFQKALFNFLIDTPIQFEHEISWGLWLAKAMDITLDEKIGEKISGAKSPIVRLMALDLDSIGLLKGLDVANWEKELSKNPSEDEDHWIVRILYHSNWILAYEACMYGWLGLNRSVLDKDGYFSQLAKRDIHFFISDRILKDSEIDFGLSYLGVGGFAGTSY